MTRVLHWFRSDLRLHDNTALQAAASAGQVIALYIATPAQWRAHDDAPVKQDYWRRNLQILEQELAQRGIPLLYADVAAYQDIPALLEQLLPLLNVTALHCNREYPVNERVRDQQVASVCKQLGVSWQPHNDQTLLAPETVLNKSGQPFKVFTPYAKTVRERLALATPPVLPAPAQQSLPSLPVLACCRRLNELGWPAAAPEWETLWPAGAARAQQQLQAFTAASIIGAYKEQRDIPAVAGTSQLSPQLAAGVLSIRQCWHATLQADNSAGVFAWQNELLWRDFYKQVLWHFPHVCKKYQWRTDLGHIPWRHDQEDFTRWCEGRTGIPIVDAAMRQLLHTGWMHNRLRMITAMFLSKQLLIDWRWGERWFMQQLVDGDFSANNGGWQWSASTGTDAAPYFRIFNPVTQSQRFDPEGTFIRHWVPELAELDNKSIHDPGLWKPADYPAPLVDLAFGRERALNAFKLVQLL